MFWDSQRRRVQITDFSRSTLFGVPRTPVTGSPDWIPKEQRSRTLYGNVGPRDDVWAAGRLIFFVRNQGEELVNRSQLTDSGLDGLFGGLFGQVFGPPEGRPTASDLLEHGLHRRSPVPPAADGSARLIAGRGRFLEARQRRHHDAVAPRDFNTDIDWMGEPGGAAPAPDTSPGTGTAQSAAPTQAAGQADETTAGPGPRADDRTWETGRTRQFPWRRGD